MLDTRYFLSHIPVITPLGNSYRIIVTCYTRYLLSHIPVITPLGNS